MDLTDDTRYRAQTFRQVRLPGIELRGATFEECVFDHCALPEATFRRCRFSECRFVSCDLSVLKVPNSRWAEVSFTSCKLVGIDWTQTEPQSTKTLPLSLAFDDCVLDLSTFFGLNLRGGRMTRCSAKEVDFAEADLRELVCTGTDFAAAKFLATNLEKADFRGATGYTIDPTANRVKGARFALPEAVSLLRGLKVIVE